MIELNLRDKSAIVTGAASGIGREIAVALAREGVRSIVIDRKNLTEVVEQIEISGGEALAVQSDLTDPANVEDAFARALAHLGVVDIYVNCHAVALHQGVDSIDIDAWETTVKTNLSSCALACVRIARRMKHQRSGAILMVGSTAADSPRPTEAAYRASKAGLRAYMEVLAVELAPFNVRVNMLTPGFFKTGLTAEMTDSESAVVVGETPMRRQGRLPELIPVALLLVSNSGSSFITGSEFRVDGGLHLRPMPINAVNDLEWRVET